MHPSIHAIQTPDKPAVIIGETAESMTYGELEKRSNRIAHLLRREGLTAGHNVAVIMDNVIDYFPVVWAAQRAGLYFTCVSSRLMLNEVQYIIADSEAKTLIVGVSLGSIGLDIQRSMPGVTVFAVGDDVEGLRSIDAEMTVMPDTPIADEGSGIEMLYSSGTTGRPKGVKPQLTNGPLEASNAVTDLASSRWGLGKNSIFLSPAPLYHAAPLRFCMAVHKLGGTVVVMKKFDASEALRQIERYRVSHAQWVPTHFVRLLKLPAEERSRYDLSSVEAVWHAAAPCPVTTKRAMLEWWGMIIHEYYSGTEINGLTVITPDEWLTRPGSVGRAVWGEPKICDDDGEELPPRSEGLSYFANGYPCEYHNEPEKTAAATNKYGWTTIGDVGWVDEERYLYLTDRKSFMIISGGVNIYPQEIEDVLISHPAVMDVAVVSAPDEDMGEKVVAVVQPVDWNEAGPTLAAELAEWLIPRMSSIKRPRLIEFERELPRHPTGKLYKRLIRDRYWMNKNWQGEDVPAPAVSSGASAARKSD